MRQSKRTSSADLSIDIWHMVMLFVAQSPDGGRSLAIARSVCKIFKEAADNKQVLRTVKFEYRYPSNPDTFWNTNGLPRRCLDLANGYALDLLIKFQTSKLVTPSLKRLKEAADNKKVLHSLKLWPPFEEHNNVIDNDNAVDDIEAKKDIDEPGQTAP